MKNLFSIGELSKLQNISRQTLIFYDKIGLFRPAYTDPDNGYRYYSSSQLDYLDTICIMKRIGFSLNEIKAHMKSFRIENSIAALRKQLSTINHQIEELQMIKNRVEHRCLQLEHSISIRDCSDIVSIEEVSPNTFCFKRSRNLIRWKCSALLQRNVLFGHPRSNFQFSFRAVRSCRMNVFCGEDIPKHRLPFCSIEKSDNIDGVLNFPKGGAYLPITQGTIFPSEDPTKRIFRILPNPSLQYCF